MIGSERAEGRTKGKKNGEEGKKKGGMKNRRTTISRVTQGDAGQRRVQWIRQVRYIEEE